MFFGLQLLAFIFRNFDDGTPSNIMFYAAAPLALITFRVTKDFLIKKEKPE